MQGRTMFTVESRTISDQVQARLRELILSNQLLPGTRIDQTELARQMGVSIIPLREAIARLQTSGLVRIIPRRGAFVEPISADELTDIYFVREVLEEQSGRLAANRLTDDDVTQLTELVAHMERATAIQHYDDLFELNRAFHFTIYRAAHRPQLLALIQQLWDKSDRYRRLYTYLPERADTALAEHKAILTACQRRNVDALGTALRVNVRQTTTGLLERMTQQLPEQQ